MYQSRHKKNGRRNMKHAVKKANSFKERHQTTSRKKCSPGFWDAFGRLPLRFIVAILLIHLVTLELTGGYEKAWMSEAYSLFGIGSLWLQSSNLIGFLKTFAEKYSQKGAAAIERIASVLGIMGIFLMMIA
ncbi:hypothetical protein OZX73_05300 [Bifidobacterium sp. ESL0775]|uniref:hypothetical protein n=1 Tax=Bifidobacterium sp. ESL0775 TaxID=2983230 RepID=UPI0023F853CD|nr:hypothetical protein [Bifidobacterium sp. ESL0775]WEV68708.1 hypothetical protein OZX73_05300 [Bifidobacterium sp. ESL0775]